MPLACRGVGGYQWIAGLPERIKTAGGLGSPGVAHPGITSDGVHRVFTPKYRRARLRLLAPGAPCDERSRGQPAALRKRDRNFDVKSADGRLAVDYAAADRDRVARDADLQHDGCVDGNFLPVAGDDLARLEADELERRGARNVVDGVGRFG